jgi:uncharacterized protein RhaS with RHS repeats
VTRYSYDPNNNWLTAKIPDPSFGAPNVTFTYTATGQRELMKDASGTTSYVYDQRDRLTQKGTLEVSEAWIMILPWSATLIAALFSS